MGWEEKLKNIQFTIKTGDGKTYEPLWKNSTKEKKFNISKYDFINVEGSFIDRKKPQAAKYPLIFWFQGDDNIEQSERFWISADDPRPWEIKHPFYGDIVGQPIGISRSDIAYNSTKIVVEFWESISADFPNPKTDIASTLVFKTAGLATIAAANYNSDIKPVASDQLVLQDSITQITSVFGKLFDNETFAEYQILKGKAESNAGNLVSSPLNAITSIQDLVLAPSTFGKPVKDRVGALKNAFNKLVETLGLDDSVSTKLYFESQGGTTLAAVCQASATPIESDYITKNEIEEISSDIVSMYEQYLLLLDTAQVTIFDIENTFHADQLTQIELYELVVETTGNLFFLAFQAKQERTIEVDKDTNLILLTHKFLGAKEFDSNLEDFRELNNIRNDELFKIKKGRQIKYFV